MRISQTLSFGPSYNIGIAIIREMYAFIYGYVCVCVRTLIKHKWQISVNESAGVVV